MIPVPVGATRNIRNAVVDEADFKVLNPGPTSNATLKPFLRVWMIALKKPNKAKIKTPTTQHIVCFLIDCYYMSWGKKGVLPSCSRII